MAILDLIEVFITILLLIFGGINGNYLAQISVFLVFNLVSIVLKLCGNLIYILIY